MTDFLRVGPFLVLPPQFPNQYEARSSTRGQSAAPLDEAEPTFHYPTVAHSTLTLTGLLSSVLLKIATCHPVAVLKLEVMGSGPPQR
jgi:hypothetical protein